MKNKSRNVVNIINPLNLKDSYNDNVLCMKIILNLCNNDELKKLGNQIIDSFLLINILNQNKKIKFYNIYYENLYNKLALTINKISKFEKIMRNSNIITNTYLSDKYVFKKDISTEYDDLDIILNSSKVFMIIDNKINYSLNRFIDDSNLFKKIILKDENQEFKKYFTKKDKKKIKFSKEIMDLFEKKNKILVNTLTQEKEITDLQIEKYNSVNIELKQLIELEYKINDLSYVLNQLNNQIFILEPEVVNLYLLFKNECNNEYNNSIKLKKDFVKNINNILLDKKNNNKKLDFNDLRKKVYKDYLYNRLNNSNNRSYINYIKYNQNLNENFVEEELKKGDEYLSLYSSYLIYKSGLNNDNPMSFDDFVNTEYGKKNVETIYKI